ncbi:MAG: cell division protein FtsA [Armatimonadetes bacterium]|nr:cell division protein FtsA [Armatimonadota bacterium]MDW8123067.1 cell division protein FtsA [Armatimonadota bacterium]
MMTLPSHPLSQPFVTGLDVGTTKVRTLIARLLPDSWTIIGHSSVEMIGGMKKATVVDLPTVKEAVAESLQRAEQMAGIKVDQVWVGVTGQHIRSQTVAVSLRLSPEEPVVGDGHLQELVEQAKAYADLSSDRTILHALPTHLSLNGVSGVRRPVGMAGRELKANVHIITAFTPFLQNLEAAVRLANVKVAGLVLQPLVAGRALLTETEQQLGTALIDIGGGTTDVAVFRDGDLVYTFAIPIGGAYVTQDLSIGLRTSLEEAETLKIRWGTVKGLLSEEEMVEVHDLGHGRARVVSRSTIADIIEARMREILELVRDRLERSQWLQSLFGGAVLTGGGSLLDGCVALSEEVLQLPCRRGEPSLPLGAPQELKSPLYSTVVGLVLYGMEKVRLKPAEKSFWKSAFQTLWNKVRALLGL